MSDFTAGEMGEIEGAMQEWENHILKPHLEHFPETRSKFLSDSGAEVQQLYTPLDVEQRKLSYLKDVGFPGQYPFTRGINPNMYRSLPWPIAEYGGFGTAKETNAWFKYLFSHGARNLGLALDLPTQIGYDSDHHLAKGEVGKTGVSVNSLRDMEIIFDGLKLDGHGNGLVANSIGPIFLALYIATAEKQGIAENGFIIWLQNDPLKEYLVRGTYIFPPKVAVKFAGDVVEYVVKHNMIQSSPIWFCGYHYKEAGATSQQEIAFPIANGEAYVQELKERGVTLDDFGNRVMWNMTAGVDFFEEIAKYRALRRLWARVAREDHGATKEASVAVRIAAFTAGSGFTAQQPLNNIVRGCIGGMAAVLGGCQNLVISGYDEALSIPSEEAGRISLRTQQIIADESRIAYTADPLAGSYYVESLTDDLERGAREILEQIRQRGGALECIENGYLAREIANAAYEKQRQFESGERVLVGVNKYQLEEAININIRRPNPKVEEEQLARLAEIRKERDSREVMRKLQAVKKAAKENENTVIPIKDALLEYATIGEICDTLREVWGTYTATAHGV